jgi:DNA repair protein RecO (recombination protein O)
MEWSDEAIILGVAKYGESDAILDVLTRRQGRYRGFVKGGLSRRFRGDLQPGNSLNVTWRARVSSNLGRFTTEIRTARAPLLFEDKIRLSGLTSLASLLLAVLPEREPCDDIFVALEGLLSVLCGPDFTTIDCGIAMVIFEQGLLGYLGFGLDLSACAATGVADDLIYVSPRTGRAVSAEAGKPYHDKLLRMPAFLIASADENEARKEDILDGFVLTGHFLDRHVLAPAGRTLPEPRLRFVTHFE